MTPPEENYQNHNGRSLQAAKSDIPINTFYLLDLYDQLP